MFENDRAAAVRRDIVRSSLELAAAHAERGRFHEARAAYLSATAHDSTTTSRLAFAAFLNERGRHEAALEQWRIVLDVARRNGDRRTSAVALHNAAAAMREVGDYHAAVRLEQAATALELRAANRGESTSPSVLSGTAVDALLRGEYELACALLRSSLEVECSEDCSAGQAADWGNLGVCAILRGDLDDARACLVTAYRLHRRLGDDVGVARDMMNMAEVFRRTGRPDLSRKSLDYARECFERNGRQRLAMRCDQIIADLDRILAVRTRNVEAN